MRDILGLVPKPSHYAGGEWNAVIKDPSAVEARIALAFPDLYEVGMSYLGQKILYGLINDDPRFYAERVFAPSMEAAAVMRERGAELATLETDTPLAKLDAIGFHLTHELCYTNILYMLDLAGIPLRAHDRPDYPLVMAGGGCVGNAEPVAAFFDLMVLGDGEEILPLVMAELAKARKNGEQKSSLLARLRGLPGIYVPAFFVAAKGGTGVVPLDPDYAAIDKALVADLDAAYSPDSQISPCGKAVHDRLTLEIARGCTRGCRFCQAGMIYRPVRERSLPRIEAMLDKGLSGGFEEISLLSLSTGDFSALESLFCAIVPRCGRDQVAVSLPSLRAGTLSRGIMRAIAGIRRTGATMAPEAGSARLRDVINKGIGEDDILAHTRRLFESGWQQVKLYFMIGLPTETDEDLAAIVDLAAKILAQGKGAQRLAVTVSVSPFVPKPHTPFQWERQIGLAEIREKLDLLRSLIRPHRKIKFVHHLPEMSYLEGVFSRGGRELADVVESAFRKGALFCSWTDHLRLEPWLAALAEAGLDMDAYLAERDINAPLPWDHLNVGVTKAYLAAERARALAGKLTGDCRYQGCKACGVCGGFGFTPSLKRSDASVHPRLNRAEPEWENLDGLGLCGAADAREKAGAGETAWAGETAGAGETAEAGGTAEGAELTHKALRLRVWYTKKGPAVYLSQLELTSLFERALRRARVNPTFSGGFHPLPLLSFGWAIPVGVASESEWFGVFLREDSTPEAFCRAFAGNLPAGLTLLGAQSLPLTGKLAQPVAEDFILRLASGGDIRPVLDAWEEFLTAKTWPFTRMAKSGPKSEDARPLVASAEPEADGTLRIRFDWSAAYQNPLKLAAAISKLTPQDLALTKISQLFAKDAQPELTSFYFEGVLPFGNLE